MLLSHNSRAISCCESGWTVLFLRNQGPLLEILSLWKAPNTTNIVFPYAKPKAVIEVKIDEVHHWTEDAVITEHSQNSGDEQKSSEFIKAKDFVLVHFFYYCKHCTRTDRLGLVPLFWWTHYLQYIWRFQNFFGGASRTNSHIHHCKPNIVAVPFASQLFEKQSKHCRLPPLSTSHRGRDEWVFKSTISSSIVTKLRASEDDWSKFRNTRQGLIFNRGWTMTLTSFIEGGTTETWKKVIPSTRVLYSRSLTNTHVGFAEIKPHRAVFLTSRNFPKYILQKIDKHWKPGKFENSRLICTDEKNSDTCWESEPSWCKRMRKDLKCEQIAKRVLSLETVSGCGL